MTANRFRFRAWCSKLNEMIYCDKKPVLAEISKNGLRIDVNFGFAGTYDCVIMQSTGLLDRNGKEIFEGDIIQVKPPSHTTSWGASRFLPHLVEWRLLDSIEPSENMVGFDLPQDWQQMEIVGNIYENGDLLK